MEIFKVAFSLVKKYANKSVLESAKWIEKTLKAGRSVKHPNGTKAYLHTSPDGVSFCVISAKGWKSYFSTIEEAAIEAAKCGEDPDYIPGNNLVSEVNKKYEDENMADHWGVDPETGTALPPPTDLQPGDTVFDGGTDKLATFLGIGHTAKDIAYVHYLTDKGERGSLTRWVYDADGSYEEFKATPVPLNRLKLVKRKRS